MAEEYEYQNLREMHQEDLKLIADLQEENDRLKHERDCLAKAIGDAAVEIGIVKDGAPLSGPQLLLLMKDIVRGYNSVWVQYQRVMEDIGI